MNRLQWIGVLVLAGTCIGSVGHMVAELFKTSTGTRLTHVPYKGNGAAITDTQAGNVQFMFSAPATVLQHIKGGKLRGIATSSAARVHGLDEVPTFTEAGYPQVQALAWYGVLAAVGTPRAVVTRLNTELVRILNGIC